ncbi:MAG: hypothetical protein WBC05_08430 [Sedimentisphaerales bacterium]
MPGRELFNESFCKDISFITASKARTITNDFNGKTRKIELGEGGAMDKQKKSAILRFPAILWAVSAILLFTLPCDALEVPLPSGETTLNVDYPINESVLVKTDGTLNLLDGGSINGATVDIAGGGTLNIEGGYISGDVFVASGSEVNIRGGSISGKIYDWDISVDANAKVTVFGTDFSVTNDTIDPSGTYFTPDTWPPCLLTGTYGGDAGPIELEFYVFFPDTHIFLAAPAQDLIIDIKPGSDQNSINLKSKGVVPVAVLTTDDFNAATIDPATALFAGAEPVRWKLEDVDDDGDDDLMFHFKTQELDLDQDSTEATLKAELLTEVMVSGTDEVRIVPSKK